MNTIIAYCLSVMNVEKILACKLSQSRLPARVLGCCPNSFACHMKGYCTGHSCSSSLKGAYHTVLSVVSILA